MKALPLSQLRGIPSRDLMLITYQGSKAGKMYTNPIGYSECDTDELPSFTYAHWWVNMLDGAPTRLF